MTSPKLYPVPESVAQQANVSTAEYASQYRESIVNSDIFWLEQAKQLDWISFPTKANESIITKDRVDIKWFSGGKLNASVNCLDRHLPDHSQRIAFYWEGDSPDDSKAITYLHAFQEVCRLANGLRQLGVQKGDRVAIYMPMVPEAAFAMLACARIGAVHSVIFGGFSPNAIADRINDSSAKVIITADEGRRAGKTIPLKANVDKALENDACPSIKSVLVFTVTNADTGAGNDIDVNWNDLKNECEPTCEPEVMDAEDPLFILYTSGSTGKPKGVVHTTGGYQLYTSMTFKTVFDYKQDDIYWCSADVGWITGHSYMIYGPMANAVTQVFFEGVPTYPDVRRIAQVVEKYKVNILYTAPTAIRALMAHGYKPVEGCDTSSLRLLGSVGEPINPEAWEWYHRVIGSSQCPIMDTWWQTETGGIMITPLAGVTDLKPGSATQPMLGIQPALFDAEGNEVEGAGEGNLVIKQSWPSQARTVYGDHERFIQTYFSTYPGVYFTGDGAKRDEDGYYWITGRVDDVLNVSGHRLGTAEIESALVAHEKVAEAAVVGYAHDIKGQGIYVYVTLNEGIQSSNELAGELKNWVKNELSPIAVPDKIQWAEGLPKTRSGKIMRRILRKIAANEHEQLGDTSTLADPSVVDKLIQERLNK
ncbi:acetate--CoA ligase [Alteromonas sp. ASW11-130]|uniref:acetate--CoA ligase n=1 Tax=Alteromonas sp. ASW11-130 TaxID=3015775 RepID=UPI0022422741|nr:acetate--CoA ligase [Alteromonas sp. ASW11-130]MCW8092611.1 acetate--CoA ligase [Alteromonas sp. ASW11-130]